LPLNTPMIAMADVGLHLALASSVPMKFLALTQLLFGFGVTAAILRLDGRLNEFWFAFLLFFGTLMIGSGIGWLLLILVGQILGGMESVVRLPALNSYLRPPARSPAWVSSFGSSWSGPATRQGTRRPIRLRTKRRTGFCVISFEPSGGVRDRQTMGAARGPARRAAC
jgi:hypothetical protein